MTWYSTSNESDPFFVVYLCRLLSLVQRVFVFRFLGWPFILRGIWSSRFIGSDPQSLRSQSVFDEHSVSSSYSRLGVLFVTSTGTRPEGVSFLLRLSLHSFMSDTLPITDKRKMSLRSRKLVINLLMKYKRKSVQGEHDFHPLSKSHRSPCLVSRKIDFRGSSSPSAWWISR